MENKNDSQKKKLLIGLFFGREQADRGLKELVVNQYTTNEINIIMSNYTKDKLFSEINYSGAEPKNQSSLLVDGLKTGSTTGGILVGITAFVEALGANLVIPGLGLVALGCIVAGLVGVGAGGIIGALKSFNVPEVKANLFNEKLKKGKILLAVHPRNFRDAEKFEFAWKEIGAEEIFDNGF